MTKALRHINLQKLLSTGGSYGDLWRRSLSKQLLGGFGVALVMVGGATLGVNYALLRSQLKEQVAERALSITRSLQFGTEGSIEAGYISLLDRVVQNYSTLPAVEEIAIVSPEGMTIADSSGLLKNQVYAYKYPQLREAIDQAATTGVETNVRLHRKGKPVLVQILPFTSVLFGTTGKRGVALAIIDLHRLEAELWQTFSTSTLTMLCGTGVILLFMGLLIHHKVIKPLQNLNQAVTASKATGSFSLPEIIPLNEIGFLAQTLDAVFRELEAFEQLQREITQRRQAEAALRESEARERAKSEQLAEAIKNLKQAQAKLIQSEKMSGLGQIAAGIAHEINNPIGFIYTNITFVQEYFEELVELLDAYQKTYPHPPQPIEEIKHKIEYDFILEDFPNILSSMKSGTERIRTIVLSLRNFSRLDESEIKLVDIREGIKNSIMLLHHRIAPLPNLKGEKIGEITVIENYGQLPLVECYPSQLNQVFLNLLNNAIDAIEELWLNGDSTRPAPGEIKISTSILPSERIAITIKDNGIGMPPEVQSRLFEPFFTTKPVGKGTGLGLSVCYEIVVKMHGGELKCHSAFREGTEIVVEIPIRQQNQSSITP
ncbi:MAG TPA: sensor histidine kinase [Oscillatoriaceae cyanobacterium M33_DOE_052]|uniref:histidine kinase n=1 Tax=Planktothricoides sp. SpSt-374 TaxID=2282167 RepID=A0A7C3VJE7_9CYAN|nr:sensor histidine kinase [Oscillatoriaceae cyanobacterium M33_DOE_052]